MPATTTPALFYHLPADYFWDLLDQSAQHAILRDIFNEGRKITPTWKTTGLIRDYIAKSIASTI